VFSPEVIHLLEDFRVARMTLVDRERGEVTLECAVRVTAHSSLDSSLDARFAPGTLPEGLAEAGLPCRVVCEAGLAVLSIQARIETVADAQLLQLRIEGESSHDDPRHHFRVDTQVSLRYWKIRKSPPAATRLTEVNLSSGGIRFTTDEGLDLGEPLSIEMLLPGSVPKVVKATGRVVGVLRKEGQGQEVVLKFTKIGADHLGRLREFCLGVKFRQMCNRAELLGSILKPSLPDE
jgi:PilZ domain